MGRDNVPKRTRSRVLDMLRRFSLPLAVIAEIKLLEFSGLAQAMETGILFSRFTPEALQSWSMLIGVGRCIHKSSLVKSRHVLL
jgi:hypothetical protein